MLATMLNLAHTRLGMTAQKISKIRNWYMFTRPGRKLNLSANLAKVKFRDGLVIFVRPKTHDLFIVYEVFLESAYRAMEIVLSEVQGPVHVVDLGAHIGCFSLRALRARSDVFVDCYEPSADNRAVLNRNLLTNGFDKDRVRVFEEAAGGEDRVDQFYHDPSITVDSSLYGTGVGVKVPVASLKTVLKRSKYPVAILKIDIEGAEYELLETSTKEDWDQVFCVMAEVHSDPSGKSSQEAWLLKMRDMGFAKQSRDNIGVLLERQ